MARIKSDSSSLSKLGWLNSYSRQVLLLRFWMRALFDEKYFRQGPTNRNHKDYLIRNLFRMIVDVASAENLVSANTVAPFYPNDRPDFFSVAVRDQFTKLTGNNVRLSIVKSLKSRPSNTHDDLLVFTGLSDTVHQERNSLLEAAIGILEHEILEVSKGIKLSNKKAADLRAHELLSKPLWRGFAGQKLGTISLAEIERIESLPEGTYSFWKHVLSGFENGLPVSKTMLSEVAALHSVDWFKGSVHVAERIAAIQADILQENARLAESVDVNPVTGLIRAIPREIENPSLLGALISRVKDALADSLQENNGLNENSYDVRVLTRTIERYGNDPQRVEMDFTSIAISLRRQIYDTLDLPESAYTLSLLGAIEEGARGVRATHPDVLENRETLAHQTLRELSQERKDVLSESLPFLQSITEGSMSDDFATDLPILINDTLLPLPNGAPRLPSADAAMRVFGRSARISVLLRTETAIKAVHASTGYKAIDITMKVSFVVSIGLWLYGVL